MSAIKNMLLTGCGTSRHAAELGAKIMRDLECFDTVSVMDSAEVRGWLVLCIKWCEAFKVIWYDSPVFLLHLPLSVPFCLFLFFLSFFYFHWFPFLYTTNVHCVPTLPSGPSQRYPQQKWRTACCVAVRYCTHTCAHVCAYNAQLDVSQLVIQCNWCALHNTRLHDISSFQARRKMCTAQSSWEKKRYSTLIRTIS